MEYVRKGTVQLGVGSNVQVRRTQLKMAEFAAYNKVKTTRWNAMGCSHTKVLIPERPMIYGREPRPQFNHPRLRFTLTKPWLCEDQSMSKKSYKSQ